MNESIHITERLDQALNILQRIPGLQGFDQWNPVCECMKLLAGLGRDVQAYEKEHPEQEETDAECKTD